MPEDKKTLFKRIGFIGLPLLVLLIVLFYWHASKVESTDDAFIEAHIVPISSRVAGSVQAVHVKDNQLVQVGEALAEIDPRDYEAKLAQQRAKANASEAEAKRANADAQRYEQIFKQDEISQQQLDNAKAAAATSQATYEKELAALKQDELNLSYTKLTAPEAGLVTRKGIEQGAYVQVGQTLLSIVPEEVWVVANFKETQLTHVRPGQKVSIKVDTYPGHTFEGHVDSVQAGTGERFSVMPPENATGNYVKVVQRIPVKIVIDTPPDRNFRLAPGMSVVPTIRVK